MAGSTSGARWLAHELIEIGAAENSHFMAEGSVIQHDRSRTSERPPQVYPLLWRLDLPSLEALAGVCGQSVGEFVRARGGV